MVADARTLTLFHDEPTGLDFAGDLGETTPISWRPKHDLTFDEWQAIGNTLQQVSASLKWWIGDWLNYGEHRWGDMYTQAIEITGWEYQTLANAKSVCNKVDFYRRRENLKFSHHAEVASLESEVQTALLLQAEVEGWSVRRLREAIKGPVLPKLSVSFAEPTEPPFNHRARTELPADDRTAVDEYEQQAEELASDETAYDWTKDQAVNIEDRHGHVETIHVRYPEQPEQIYTNGVNKPHVTNNSGNNEWYTPVDFIEAARLTLGDIDLDPATSIEANTVVRASNFYTIDDDGLSQWWEGKVWLNPPYSSDLVSRFISKLVDHYQAGDVTEAIVLVNNATETQWFQFLASQAEAICFPAKRIRFWSPNGGNGSPLQGQALLYLGHNSQNFIDNFQYFGLLVSVAASAEALPEIAGE